MQDNYRQLCGEDEQNARHRLAEEDRKRRDVRTNEALAEKAERERQTISREQCDKMYRILHRRRQGLAAMTEGERGDFERFEANWKARCGPA